MSPHKSKLSPEEWKQVSELFDRALDLPEADRPEFLRTACSGDAALLSEVSALVDAAMAGDSFLDEGALDFVAPALEIEEPYDSVEPGGRLGPYRIIRRIGIGGMSQVYLVERDDDQFRRQAALKILDVRGTDPAESRRRFQAERQILATLDHPNIAAVHDAGMTLEGQPYLILEYVPGEPITHHCLRTNLSLEVRLDLFETVCRAVHHAHQHLVVHRDLKPGNILVREDGVVKLLDFGIAKLLDDGSTPLPVTAPVTVTGLRLLTPEYAAPEQVVGDPITTATDVYSLGVLLYELLTGRRPYDVNGLSPAAVEKMICEIEPPRPSTVAAKSEAGTGAVPARRLRGDLDTIVMKALRKEPGARYDSPGDMADDLRRSREGYSILARTTSLAYRTRRYFWRNRILSSAAVLLLGFAVFHVVRVTEESAQARREAAKAGRIAEFLQDLFEVADPDVARGRSTTARDLVDRAAERLHGELAEEPDVRATMLTVLGSVYERLGLYDEASALVEEGLEIRRTRNRGADEETAASLEVLGRIRHDQGRFLEADSLIGESLVMRERLFGGDSPEVARSLNQLGGTALDQSNFDAADSLLDRALQIRRSRPGPVSAETAETLNNIGVLLMSRRESAEAETIHREALAIRRQVLGANHSSVYESLMNLGDALEAQGRYAESVTAYREAAEGMGRVLGPEHSRYAGALNSLGPVLFKSGRYEEADSTLRRAIDIRRRTLGEDHPEIARNLNDLAALYRDREDFKAAVPLYRESLAISRRSSGVDHAAVAIIEANLATALRELGEYDEAEALLLSAERSYVQNFGEDNPRTTQVRLRIALVRHARGDRGGAERLYRELLEPYRRHYPNDHPGGGYVLVSLGRLLHETGRHEEALRYLNEGHRVFEKGMGPGSMQTAKAAVDLASCLIALGDYSRADTLLAGGLTVEEKYLAADNPGLAAARRVAIRLYEATGRPAEAREQKQKLPG